MRLQLVSTLATAAFAAIVALGAAEARADVYGTIFHSVDQSHLQKLLKDMTGFNPVTVNGETFTISNRYLAASKANYRKYWTQYFEDLGMDVTPYDYDSSFNIEAQGHNLEAVLPGKSPDSIVIIVHYDSMGPHGYDNEAVDDDMTGMATLMETARMLVPYKDRLQHTIRFVATDYEEWGGLEGARYYASEIKKKADAEGFKIVAAIDDEQSGWKEGANTFDYFDCGGAHDSPELGNLLASVARQYGTIGTHHDCMGENSDHYAMWEIGVPAIVFSEHDPFSNPHFDHAGGDTYARIDQAYYFKIAQVGITFAARLVGIDAAD